MDFTIIKKIRTSKKIKLKELCKKTGLSAPTLINLEKNIGNITIENLEKIAKCLGMNTSTLVRLCETGEECRGKVSDMKADEFLELIGVKKERWF